MSTVIGQYTGQQLPTDTVLASVWFDHSSGSSTRSPGQWTTTVVYNGGEAIAHDRWRTQHDARAYVGLSGGSKDPEFKPERGDFSHSVVAIDRVERAVVAVA